MPPSNKRLAAAAALATAIAIPAEGLRQYAYYDPPGILTVCYGSTVDVEKGRKYSLAECRARLDADMATAVRTVEACQPGLPENVLAAFADAVYNMGPTIACNRSAVPRPGISPVTNTAKPANSCRAGTRRESPASPLSYQA